MIFGKIRGAAALTAAMPTRAAAVHAPARPLYTGPKPMTMQPSVHGNDLSALKARLTDGLGPDGVICGEDRLSAYAQDWSPAPAVTPLLVIRPRTTEDVATAVRLCADFGTPIVTQGGRTGLSGAATPKAGEVALSLERMAAIEEVDAEAMVMTAQAGVTLAEAQDAAERAGRLFPMDIAARGSCTLGGLAATNAGGNRVLRYGPMRDSVLGVEAVLADGSIVGGLNRMRKNNAGYDLKHLFLGTEGTIGIVTRLALRLHPLTPDRACAACALTRFDDVVALLSGLNESLGATIECFEVMWADYVSFVRSHRTEVAPPFAAEHPFVVIVEQAGSGGAIADGSALAAALTPLMERGVVADAVICKSLAERESLWHLRDVAGELLGRELPHAVTFDISLPLSACGPTVERARAFVEETYPGAIMLTFGHLGDGNVHIAIAPPTAEDAHAIEAGVLALAAEAGGSITGEHGVGVLKRDFLGLSRSAADITAMRTLKAAFDPHNRLNPGRVI